MTKPKIPLLSFEAHGTLADAITHQRRAGAQFARRKPIPTNPKTLPQVYQRWDYRDYAYLWTTLTPSEQRSFHSQAVRHHMTGFAYYLSLMLLSLDDLAIRLHLDTQASGTTIDSSKNRNDATIYGALPVLGPIDNALSFDGGDDYLNVADDPSLDLTDTISLLLWHKRGRIGQREGLIAKTGAGVGYRSYRLELSATDTLVLAFQDPAGGWHSAATTTHFTDLTQWHHFSVTYDKVNAIFYYDGLLDRTVPLAFEMATTTRALTIGLYATYYFKGLIDEVCIYNRILDSTEIKRHAERRYP